MTGYEFWDEGPKDRKLRPSDKIREGGEKIEPEVMKFEVKSPGRYVGGDWISQFFPRTCVLRSFVARFFLLISLGC